MADQAKLLGLTTAQGSSLHAVVFVDCVVPMEKCGQTTPHEFPYNALDSPSISLA